MTTCGWIILGVVVIILAVLIVVHHKLLCKYWRKDWYLYKVKLCWNNGWLIVVLKYLFVFFSKLSFGLLITYFIERKKGDEHRCRYLFVDSYVTFWVGLIVLFSMLAINSTPCCILDCIILIFLSYRLFEIFQSWVSQYILGGVSEPWKTRNIYRNLVLVFLDYGEVIFSYALLAFILKNNFSGITCWQQSFLYSLGHAVTIGSNNIVPTTSIGYALFATQLMFTLLFLVAAVNRIIAVMKK